MKKGDQETIRNLFQPTLGNRPVQYIGRDGVIEQFMSGLREPIGSWFSIYHATDWLLYNSIYSRVWYGNGCYYG